MAHPPLDFETIKARLQGSRGRVWRSLDELAGTSAFTDFLGTEFPSVARLAAGPDRRHFLRLMAASLALAGIAGCRDDADGRTQEVPYVRNPESMVPGAPMRYASAALIDGFANGVRVTTRNGRPIKIEGNPDHPWSRGGTDVLGQASVLGLYDPFRSQAVRYLTRIDTWAFFRGAMIGRFGELRARKGKGLRLLTGPVTSPSLIAQIQAMQRDFPDMHWHSYAPVDRAPLYAATRAVFGKPLETRWHFDRARVLVSLDGDCLDAGPQQVGAAVGWAAARRQSAAEGRLLELHAAAPSPTLTSAKADYHLAAGADAMSALADGLMADLSGQAPFGSDPLSQWRARAGAALRDARGQGIVMAGAAQPVAVQAAAHRLNAALGNIGQTVVYTEPVPAQTDSLAALAQAMERGEVEVLVMLGVNPVYDAPADLDVAARLLRVPLTIHAGAYDDETAINSTWHLPLTHPLESWGDARSLDGTVTLIQPTILPLYDGRSVPELLSLLTDPEPRGGLDLLRSHWQGSTDPGRFAPQWHQALLQGFIANSALPAESVRPQPAAAAPQPMARAAGVDVVFRPDPSVWDGSVANNGWLQELPRPLTKLTWENVIAIPPGMARRGGIAQGDVVTLEAEGRRIDGPAWIMPGQAEDTVTVTLGYGRTAQDMLATGLGYSAYALRGAEAPWLLRGARLRRTGRTVSLATTQNHNTTEGHDLIRLQPVGAAPVGDDTAFTQPTLYDATTQETDGRAWGMVIDLDSCIGCNACVTACQAENNIAVVGREQVLAGREMHWLRVDRYYEGAVAEPAIHFQPVPCMMCEAAPCEVGCPVEATLHDHEGLNLMVYNRCVGTRACSGYCPYKVRHFNYFDYSAGAAPSLQAQRNPEVTVRARGVMEKCTYCVQRIAAARITSDRDDTPIADGTVQTACQGACPTRAITFGDLADPRSAVLAARHDPRNYALLGELNTRPRTTYLAAFAPAPTKAEG
jgi:molybdopterin-containing oxidoreductase family iron-sulfur binding subunit